MECFLCLLCGIIGRANLSIIWQALGDSKGNRFPQSDSPAFTGLTLISLEVQHFPNVHFPQSPLLVEHHAGAAQRWAALRPSLSGQRLPWPEPQPGLHLNAQREGPRGGSVRAWGVTITSEDVLHPSALTELTQGAHCLPPTGQLGSRSHEPKQHLHQDFPGFSCLSQWLSSCYATSQAVQWPVALLTCQLSKCQGDCEDQCRPRNFPGCDGRWSLKFGSQHVASEPSVILSYKQESGLAMQGTLPPPSTSKPAHLATGAQGPAAHPGEHPRALAIEGESPCAVLGAEETFPTF